MKYQTLGKSSLSVSEIGFGCMSLGEDQAHNSRIIQQAFDRGINLFDTADLYQRGQNEVMVGKAIRDFRKEIILATKVGNQWKPDGSGWVWNPRKDYILQAVENSLRRLKTDYIDLYQLHGGTIEDPIDQTIEAFEELKAKGKILQYGISSIRPNVIREYVKRSNIVSVMMQYSLLDRRPEESCLDLLAENKISVLTRGTLAKGMLIDKPVKDYLGYSEAQVAKMQTALAAKADAIPAALRYVQEQAAVASAVIGLRTEQQLAEICTANQETITGDRLDFLANLLPPNTYAQHR
ncbi:MAG TPA: aldo/keto reductase [Saprospiraceae bacterium]|nr:aldo/keto reductase [Saprospiraceae bacterium]